MPDKMQHRMSDSMSEHVSHKVPDRMSGNMPGRITQYIYICQDSSRGLDHMKCSNFSTGKLQYQAVAA